MFGFIAFVPRCVLCSLQQRVATATRINTLTSDVDWLVDQQHRLEASKDNADILAKSAFLLTAIIVIVMTQLCVCVLQLPGHVMLTTAMAVIVTMATATAARQQKRTVFCSTTFTVSYAHVWLVIVDFAELVVRAVARSALKPLRSVKRLWFRKAHACSN